MTNDLNKNLQSLPLKKAMTADKVSETTRTDAYFDVYDDWMDYCRRYPDMSLEQAEQCPLDKSPEEFCAELERELSALRAELSTASLSIETLTNIINDTLKSFPECEAFGDLPGYAKQVRTELQQERARSDREFESAAHWANAAAKEIERREEAEQSRDAAVAEAIERCARIADGSKTNAGSYISAAIRALYPSSILASVETQRRGVKPCEHKGKINRGYQNTYDIAWCDDCGIITWCSDGLVSDAEAKRHDHNDWCERRVLAFGCANEAHGKLSAIQDGKACVHWCGNRDCAVSLKDRNNDAAMSQERERK